MRKEDVYETVGFFFLFTVIPAYYIVLSNLNNNSPSFTIPIVVYLIFLLYDLWYMTKPNV